MIRRGTALLVSKRYASIDYLTSAITKNAQEVPLATTTRTKPIGPGTPADLTKKILSPTKLTDHFRQQVYGKPTVEQLSKSQALFNRANTELEWTYLNYEDIPDVKYLRLRREKMQELNGEEMKKTTFGIKPELLKVLPEVLLVGHTNAGKSSLINNLLINKVESKTGGSSTEYAFVSKRAGFTKTLNCFNIAGKLRLMDSPGYGDKGEVKQGEIVLEYISNRHQLRRVFVLIDSIEGIHPQDRQVLEYMIEYGVSFEVIFTKTDKVIAKYMPTAASKYQKLKHADKVRVLAQVEEANEKILAHYERLIGSFDERHLNYTPKFLFNNAYTNKYIPMRHGYKEIRCTILQSCGIIDDSPSTFVEESLNE